jgi:hypothetical protein
MNADVVVADVVVADVVVADVVAADVVVIGAGSSGAVVAARSIEPTGRLNCLTRA